MVSTLMNNFYTQLFSSSDPQVFERVLDGVQAVVGDEMRNALAQPYNSKEVGAAITEMAPLKAPSPNGMPLLFYPCYRSDVDMDIT